MHRQGPAGPECSPGEGLGGLTRFEGLIQSDGAFERLVMCIKDGFVAFVCARNGREGDQAFGPQVMHGVIHQPPWCTLRHARMCCMLLVKPCKPGAWAMCACMARFKLHFNPAPGGAPHANHACAPRMRLEGLKASVQTGPVCAYGPGGSVSVTTKQGASFCTAMYFVLGVVRARQHVLSACCTAGSARCARR